MLFIGRRGIIRRTKNRRPRGMRYGSYTGYSIKTRAGLKKLWY